MGELNGYTLKQLTMETYTIHISPGLQYHFQVGQYPQHPSGGCKYRIFQDKQFLASLEADSQDFLHVCQNPGKVDLEILHLLAEQIELRHPSRGQLAGWDNIEFDSDDELEAPPQNN